MRAVALLTTIGLSVMVASSGAPSAAAAETDCAPLPQLISSYRIARITVNSERHMAFIYTSDGSKFAVDASGNLVVWKFGNDPHPREEPDVAELDEVKDFAWQAAISGDCPKYVE
jgi:hypothetical protein